MADKKLTEMIKQRDEKILRNLKLAKERSAGFDENSLGYILAQNKCRVQKINNTEKGVISRNKLLKSLEEKLIGQDRLKR